MGFGLSIPGLDAITKNPVGSFLTGSAVSSPTNAYAAVGGAAASGGLNFYSQMETNRMNQRLANKQMDFQRDMSNTAHQREVDDLIAAGLNPILSAGGNGSSTPSGASATMQAPQISLPDFFSYGVSLKQLDMQQQRLELDKQNSAAAISKSLSETDLNKMKKVLLNKGMIRAELEGEGAQVLRNVIRFLKKSVLQPSVPQQQDYEDGMQQRFP